VVRAAAALVALQGLAGVGFAGYLVVNGASAAQGTGAVLPEAGLFLVIGAAVLALARGLARGRFWARTPAIVVQLLLLPVDWSLLMTAHRVVAGLLAGALLLATLALLMCPPARDWALDLDDRRRDR
jgi:hypothetical protein